jgi:TRAP-type C4-dicarboxylate transport system substrate-binding protein
VVLDAAKKSGLYATELLDQTDAKLIKDMVDNFGVEVIDLSAEERQKFIAAIEPLYTKYMANWGEECYADYTAAIKAYQEGASAQ